MKIITIHSSRRPHGLTIFELLIGISILGALASISLTSFQDNWKREKLKLATRTTAALLEDARISAIHQSKTCKLLINDTNVAVQYAEAGNTCIAPYTKHPIRH